MSIIDVLILNGCIIAGLFVALWLASLLLSDASIVDMFWGLGFVVVAWVSLFVSDVSFRSLLLVLMVTLWGVRLTAHIAWRNWGHGEDRRYSKMRSSHGARFWWISLFTVFLLQGSVMWFVALPVQLGIASATDSLTSFIYVGALIWCLGFGFESIGDYQLARFKSSAANQGQVLDTGLWYYTRHPNYFGDSMVWWGLFLTSLTASTVWTVVSPILMTFLLVKISGVALLERDLAQRSPKYREYIARTSSFIPWPPRPSKSA